MRFLFASAQLPGHLDWGGYLKTAAALCQKGHDVLWSSGKEVEPLVAAAGVPFQTVSETGWRWPPPPPLTQPTSQTAPQAQFQNSEPQHSESQHSESQHSESQHSESQTTVEQRFQRLRAERALDQWLDVNRVQQATTELLAIANNFKPDVLVGENFMSAGAVVAELLSIPFVVAGWPAAQIDVSPNNQLIVEMGHQRLNRLLQHFGAKGENWTQDGPAALLSPHLHLTYWSPSWYMGIPLLQQTIHVGGIAPQLELDSLDPAQIDRTSAALLNNAQIAETPWVFITLGTSFNHDPNFFIAASHAAHELGATPILAMGGRPTAEVMKQLNAKAARSSILVEQINFDLILPMVGAAIHHGGAGTTHALVTHAVPQILVPHAADQMHQVNGVSRSGVGVGIRPQHVTVDALSQILEEMLVEESRFHINTENIQTEFAELGGVARAAQLLIDVV